MNRKTALVIAPGRGTYNKAELGYLARHHGDKQAMLDRFDAQRRQSDQPTLSALDGAERFSSSTHLTGDNASALIHACAYADFASIDRDRFDIVAVTGNSLGWYIALACAGALDTDNGLTLVNTMGTLMHRNGTGGQIVYPFVDSEWRLDRPAYDALVALTREVPNLFVSIELGGMIVLAGDKDALAAAKDRLPILDDRFPMQLVHHAAFHTPLLQPVADRAKDLLPADLFGQPDLPLIDGRGHVWLPRSFATDALHDYTLGHQIVRTYDFTRAVQNGLKEFAPDIVIVLGPGTTLGGAVAQAMIGCNWRGLSSKSDFLARQAADPVILSMGMDAQRAVATGIAATA